MSFRNDFKQKYGHGEDGKEVKLKSLVPHMENLPGGGDEFVQLFVLYVLGNFLAPVRTRNVDLKMLKAVSVVADIRGMDWCKYVVEQLLKGLQQFHANSNSISGCVFVLLIAFLQRAPYIGIPVPTDLPLVQHWNQQKVMQRCEWLKKAGGFAQAHLVPLPALSRSGVVVNTGLREVVAAEKLESAAAKLETAAAVQEKSGASVSAEAVAGKLFGKISMDIFAQNVTDEQIGTLGLNPAQQAFMIFRRDGQMFQEP